MKIINTPKPFDIPKKLLKEFTSKEIEERLSVFNQSCSGLYYMVDHYHNKIFVDSPYSPILCGYPKDILKQGSLEFYQQITKPSEWNWLEQMYKAASKVFLRYTKSQRKKIVLSYDLTAIMINGEELILHHKVMPYKLCKNGNAWLVLCHITISASKKMTGNANFINTKTNERYEFINKKFVLSNTLTISPKDVQILRLMVQNLPDKQICGLMNNMPLNNFKRCKQRLFKKLNANTSAGAIHQAHVLGII